MPRDEGPFSHSVHPISRAPTKRHSDTQQPTLHICAKEQKLSHNKELKSHC